MFNTIAHCLVPRSYDPPNIDGTRPEFPDRPIHGIALGADWIIAGALTTIGILSLTGVLWGGLPLAAQYTLTVPGGLLVIWTLVKTGMSIQYRFCFQRDSNEFDK